ncbi:MAG: dienelactone hydrolase family protein [Proteobacteria bacterium]|nr:dienelactone hydrolase family protein [Pseudomonadota bacterium]
MRGFLAALSLVFLAHAPAWAETRHLPDIWPLPNAAAGGEGVTAIFLSHSPFNLSNVGEGPERDPPTPADARLYMPPGASAESPVPAVVLLHGAGGVLRARELTYASQYAAMGVAALVIDAFGARPEWASSFNERVLNITEMMVLADACSGLAYLASLPEVDGSRVALIGFSYGGMATTYAAQEQVAETLSPNGLRFAAHVAYYAPCIARFADRRATGAPLLMIYGGQDGIVDPVRCAEVAEDLKQGGAVVRTIVYDEAYHQWDGSFAGPRMIGRDLSDCAFTVDEDGLAHDELTWMPMSGPFLRKLILGACVRSEGYLIGRDDAVRAKSNRDVADFLNRILFREGT